MWTYIVETGELIHGERIIAHGYSGRGEGRNNPQWENVHNVGPCPAGLYRVLPAQKSGRLGPVVMGLAPLGHSACGRSGLCVHGDNKDNDASHGCIVLPRLARVALDVSIDKTLRVVSWAAIVRGEALADGLPASLRARAEKDREGVGVRG